MRIAFDFDGVCTDLSRHRAAGVNLDDYLFSPVSISLSKPRAGAMQLMSLLGLVAEVDLVSARPTDHRPAVEDWLSRYEMRQLVGTVRCCGDETKVDCMAREEIALLIDDDPAQARAVSVRFPVVRWDAEPWWAVAEDVLAQLSDGGRSRIGGHDGPVLTGGRLATDWGASHVFMLDGDAGDRFKVRVSETAEEHCRLLNFLGATARHAYLHVARLVATNGVAVMKTFVPGTPIGDLGGEARRHHIASAAAALAMLHALPLGEASQVPTLGALADAPCHLVCAADDHNLIVTPDERVVFVDLGACATGSRWVDLCWADELLCRDASERDLLWSSYLKVSGVPAADEEQIAEARRVYRLWVTEQLLRGLETHEGDTARGDGVSRALGEIWS